MPAAEPIKMPLVDFADMPQITEEHSEKLRRIARPKNRAISPVLRNPPPEAAL